MAPAARVGAAALLMLTACAQPQPAQPLDDGSEETAEPNVSAAPPVHTNVHTGIHIDSSGGVRVGVGVGVHRGPFSIRLGF